MTLKQQIVFKYIVDFIKKFGISPTYDEIMKATGIKHKSVLHQYLLRLEREGKLIRHKCKHRGIEIGKNIIKNETIRKVQQLKDIITEMCCQLVDDDDDMSLGLAEYFDQDLLIKIRECLK